MNARTMNARPLNAQLGRSKAFDRALPAGLLLLATLALTACGTEVRSESEVPVVEETVSRAAIGTPGAATPSDDGRRGHPELLGRIAEDDAAGREEEARWVVAAFVGEQSSQAESEADPPTESSSESRVEPGDAPTADGAREPALIATDTDGRQVVEFEADSDSGIEEGEADPALESESDAPPTELDAEGPFEEAELDRAPVAAPQVDVGTELVFAADGDVSTEHQRPGDVFFATLVDDVIAEDGMVLLPRGARARGRVVEAFASEDSDELPVLEVTIEALFGPEGETPVQASLVHVDLEGDARDSDRESAVKVLTGAAAGAILGRILGGDDGDAVKGGIAGAAAGAAVAYGTRGGHAKLAAGGHVVVRLTQPLTVF